MLDYAYSDAEGSHAAYRDVNGDVYIAVKNKDGRFTPASRPVFSSDGSQMAYVVNRGSKSFVVSFGNEGKQYDQISNLVFSPDGKYLAYTVHDRSINKWFAVVNGQEGSKYDFVLAKDAAEKENEVGQNIETGSLQFDAPDKFHYLAVKGKNIILVEMKLKLSEVK